MLVSQNELEQISLRYNNTFSKAGNFSRYLSKFETLIIWNDENLPMRESVSH